jgi:hypothetical protein
VKFPGATRPSSEYRKMESEGPAEKYRAVIDGVIPKMNRSACVKKRGKARAVQKMKVGPSESSYRRRLQTAMSCCSQKLWW